MINSKVLKTLEKTYENTECFWLYSSGSTGRPKGTIHLHKSLKNTAILYAKKYTKIQQRRCIFSQQQNFSLLMA